MDAEKTLLTKDLENLEANKDTEGLEKFAEDTELLGHTELAERAQKFVAELKAKASHVGVPTPSEVKEIADLEGSVTEVAQQVEATAAEASAVAAEAGTVVEAKVADANPENAAAAEASVEANEVQNEALVEFGKFDAFKATLSPELFPKPVDQLSEYMKQSYANMSPESDEYKKKWKEIADGFNYKRSLEHPFIQKYKQGLTFEEYQKNSKEIVNKQKIFEAIEDTKQKIVEDLANQERWDEVDAMQKNEDLKKRNVEVLKKNGLTPYSRLNSYFENGFISAQEIAQEFSGKRHEVLQYDLHRLSPKLVEELVNTRVKTEDGRDLPFKQYLDHAYKEARQTFDSHVSGHYEGPERSALHLAEASQLVSLFKATKRPFDEEFKELWSTKLADMEKGLAAGKGYVAVSFYENADIKTAVAIDKKVLDKIILPGISMQLKDPANAHRATKTLEGMIQQGIMTREAADKMYEEALQVSK